MLRFLQTSFPFFAFILLLMFISAFAQAQTHGLKAGQTAPDFSLPMQNDETMATLSGIMQDNGVVLFFVRSVEWCPYCQTQVRDIEKKSHDFSKLGYGLAVISYDSVEKIKKFTQRHTVSFPIISDEASDTIRAFGILSEEYAIGTFAYGVPHPTIYVISADKKITHVYQEDDFKIRSDLNMILTDLTLEIAAHEQVIEPVDTPENTQSQPSE